MKIKTLLVGCLLSATYLQVAAQTELKGWHVSPNLIDFQNVSSTVAPTVNPAWSGAPNIDQNAYNSIYDSEGKLLFTVMPDFDIATYIIYNKFNTVLSQLEEASGFGPISASAKKRTNISIIPNPANDACTAKYFIVYEGDRTHGGRFDVLYMEVDMNMNGGAGGISTAPTVIFSPLTGSNVGFAVSKLNSGQRFLYMSGNGFSGKEMRMSVVTSSGVGSPTLIADNTTVNKGSQNTAELELSEDDSKLLWSEGSDVTGTGTNDVNVMYLLPSGLPTGAANYVFSSGSPANRWKGVEFDKTGQYVFFTVPGTGIYVRDISSSTQSLIAGTANYSNSILEKTYNGNSIICASKSLGQIKGINSAGLSSTTYTWTTSYTLPAISANNFVLMPDQIDANNYDLPAVTNVDVDYYTITATTTTWTPSSNPAYTTNLNTAVTPQSTAMPLRIASGVTVPLAKTLTISGLNVRFGANAYLDVNGGGNLTLTGATLESNLCNVMWRGIVLNNNTNQTIINFTMTSGSKIYDAVKGAVVNDLYVTTTVNGASEFNKNETSLVFNGASYATTSVSNANFLATLPLKDPAYGQVVAGGSIKYGITGIEINNCGSPSNRFTIGTSTTGNYFQGGQCGINALSSDIKVQKNTFVGADGYALATNANWGNRWCDVLSNSFNSNRNGIAAIFNSNLKVTKNTFTYTTERCINWSYNYGTKLEIGTLAGLLTDANTFDSFGWWAVVVSNCDNVNTDIGIHANTIKNSPWATGIYIGEPTLTSNATTYKKYLVYLNTFTNVGTGVRITNIKGDALNGPFDDVSITKRFDICSNTINYSTAYDANARGIIVEASRNNRAFSNIITSNDIVNTGNAAINFINSENALIKNNTVKAGIGIKLELDVLGSNILCNTHNDCAIGILATWSWLRGTGAVHGIPGIQGRQNAFSGNGVDMQMNNIDLTSYQWASPNATTIGYGSCWGGSTIVASTGDPSPCGGDPGRVIAPGDISHAVYYEAGLEEYTAKVYQSKISNDEFTQVFNNMKDKKAVVVAGGNVYVLAKANSLLNAKEYQLCEAALATYVSSGNEVEDNLYTILKLQNDKFLAGRTVYTPAEKEILIGIAEKDSRTGGQGVFYARAITMYEYNLSFNDLQMEYKSGTASAGVNALEKTQDKIVFPNPTSGLVKISSDEPVKSIRITTVTGKLVAETENTGFDLSSYPAGMYFFTIITEKSQKTIKVIKE